MAKIDELLLSQLSLSEVNKVTFYKRDEITTDLICCDVEAGGKVWTFHEDQVGWASLVEHLEALPDFRLDWFAVVSQPAFVTNETVAFKR
jgi:hypothetical protein